MILNILTCADESVVRILEILLENGANPNTNYNYVGHKIKLNAEPLYCAAQKGFSKCVFSLIKHGAVINAE